MSLPRAKLPALLLVAASLTTMGLASCSSNSAADHSPLATATSSPRPIPASGATDESASSSNPVAISQSSSESSAEINVCSLLSAAQASTLVGKDPYSGATPATLAIGQDQCTYASTDALPDMLVIIYQPDSGVSFATLTKIDGATTTVPGVGDKAMSAGPDGIALDVQAGNKLMSIKVAGGIGFGGGYDGAIAVAKALVTALS